MRKTVPLNNDWRFTEVFEEAFIKEDFDDTPFQTVNLPHTNKEVPYSYFDEKMYQFVSCYRKELFVPKQYQDNKIFIDFEGVMCFAKVYLNSKLIGEHKGGYTPFSFDITDVVRFETANTLVVMVDSTERKDIPPFGNVVDYLTYGGIYREVSLRIVDSVFIDNVRLESMNLLSNEKKLKAEICLSNHTRASGSASISVKVKDKGNEVGMTSLMVPISESAEHTAELVLDLDESIELWDLENPKLYDVEITLQCGDYVDLYERRFGFRDAVFKKDGFYLNGRKRKLYGLNRHQSFPYVGYAMPKRVQRKDADILKYELGLNMVRTSHYPQSRHFLDRCDEIGLLVFEEIPGWQYIGDEEWKEVSKTNVIEMIKRDWNHPSIVLWGVRINESQDDHDFYQATNALARHTDPSRQTGGVRAINNSELLEDVYTMNDFIHDGGEVVLRDQKEITGLPENVPYLVTEYNGHMYPTKRFDSEERQMEHSVRHLRIINAAAMDDYISGAIGWCAFDYNTHKDFGSGDRICHHGVMDMFRIPKFAAYAYKSQIESQREVVLEPVTVFARGERCIGGVTPLVVMTNCEYVDFMYGGELVGRFYPAKDRYPGLTHPPVIIDEMLGEWGMAWRSGEFVGYLDGKEAKRKKYSEAPIASKLIASADDQVLSSGDMDATRIVFQIVDQEDNLIPYINETIKILVTGDGELIGPSEISLVGGCIAAWVKTKGVKGEIAIAATCSRFSANELVIQVD
ncbi:glycoside hydrolase family 2 TIM barrel-domain containing protein [Cohnella sp. REN36]|uniref:glycoside hydrolase family 2 protein n=1 Tax=Cohnella sp. REN36 TaxID=2887347 RepID=UPI001D13D8DD|nr:glycoside hydrolase family 2 TIM barrel-domain containing protein [Cohnella sp. REN36]MCC3375941.1 glycoside hydrolase family 2 protein [Cohnella sp. REN36]